MLKANTPCALIALTILGSLLFAPPALAQNFGWDNRAGHFDREDSPIQNYQFQGTPAVGTQRCLNYSCAQMGNNTVCNCISWGQ